ncbi:PQQ-dependent sugar dehydrogenase [Phormidium tenue FACHB-886]|nr:PQQ-dependent sugar dehydrogenase [Phormidium tenue FACHB-886]
MIPDETISNLGNTARADLRSQPASQDLIASNASSKGRTRLSGRSSLQRQQTSDRQGNARDLGTLSSVSLRNRIGGDRASDNYKFRIATPSQLKLSLQGLTADANVQLLNRRGAVLQTAARRGDAAESISRSLAAGTYHVRVFPAQRGSDTRYQLRLSATPTVASSPSAVNLTKQVSGLQQPVHITSAKDGSRRLFVVEQTGRIQIVQKGQVLATPFLDISDRVSTEGEQGLLSVAFPADYARKKHFYVYYTDKAGDIVISRYQLTANANVANPRSERVILKVPHPFNSNHNGGQLAFGADGFLYAGTGDGGGGGDPANNAQNPKSLLGKILRINVESSGKKRYTIPRTNPFQGAKDPTNSVRDEIWALGLRNPWRFSFDRKTGDLYIGDVGQGSFEEVNFQPANRAGGQNYGWNIREGNLPFNNSTADPTGLVSPVAGYDHSQGASITGGFVYRGTAKPALQGFYLFGDFINGKLWGLRNTTAGWQNQLLLDTPHTLSTFGEDEQGNLYVADYGQGDIYKIT